MTASRLATVACLLLAFAPRVEPPLRSAADSQQARALDTFERGDWTDDGAPLLEPAALEAAIKDLKTIAPEWIAARGTGEAPRRRLAVATYVLQLLRPQEDPYLWQGGVAMPGRPGPDALNLSMPPGSRYQRPLPAVDALEWACSLLREGPPLVAERWWHMAAMGLLERRNAARMLVLHLDHARKRFPSEDRWTLGRAVAEDLQTWPEPRDDRPFEIAPSATAALIGRYQEAMARDSVRDEALVRLGYFELRRNRTAAALALFSRVAQPHDRALRYWLALFRGQALEERQRIEDAIASYEAALLEAPYAQSAVTALAAAQVRVHHDAEAAALIDRALAIHPAPDDPWAEYVFPDWRFLSRATAELRKAVTR
jgi:hypothetical protein